MSRRVNLEDFMKNVYPEPNTGCWLWGAGVDEHGYGLAESKYLKIKRSHRISYYLHFGDFDRTLDVLHKCDNTSCVNPEHLFLGTQHDNNNYKIIRSGYVKSRKQKNGRLSIVEYIGSAEFGNKKYRVVKCKCECGNEKIVKLYEFNSETIRSCGCLALDAQRSSPTKFKPIHGFTNNELYQTWKGMIERCYNEKSRYYKDYGGRGISICDEWLTNFESFYAWAIGSGYVKPLSLDRFPNNDGNYEPSNCRWATRKQQANNMRKNIIVEVGGIKMSLSEGCEKLNVPYRIVRQRIKRDGLSFDEAATKPIRKRNG